eukprot:888137_1
MKSIILDTLDDRHDEWIAELGEETSPIGRIISNISIAVLSFVKDTIEYVLQMKFIRTITFWYIVVQWGCHIASVSDERHLNDILYMSPEVQPPNWELWRFVSKAIVHGRWGHLISNNMCQLVVFFSVEEDFGSSWRMFVVVVATAWGGSAWNLICTSGDSVGASGVCYGVAAAGLSFMLLNWPTTRHKWWKMFVLGLSCREFAYLLDPRNEISHGIAHSAHNGSQIIGFLIGGALAGHVSSFPRWRKQIKWTGIIAVATVLYVMTVW